VLFDLRLAVSQQGRYIAYWSYSRRLSSNHWHLTWIESRSRGSAVGKTVIFGRRYYNITSIGRTSLWHSSGIELLTIFLAISMKLICKGTKVIPFRLGAMQVALDTPTRSLSLKLHYFHIYDHSALAEMLLSITIRIHANKTKKYILSILEISRF
jgi:hypothetical protein